MITTFVCVTIALAATIFADVPPQPIGADDDKCPVCAVVVGQLENSRWLRAHTDWLKESSQLAWLKDNIDVLVANAPPTSWLRNAPGWLQSNPNWEKEHSNWLKENPGWLKDSVGWLKAHPTWLVAKDGWLRDTSGWLKNHADWLRDNPNWLKSPADRVRLRTIEVLKAQRGEGKWLHPTWLGNEGWLRDPSAWIKEDPGSGGDLSRWFDDPAGWLKDQSGWLKAQDDVLALCESELKQQHLIATDVVKQCTTYVNSYLESTIVYMTEPQNGDLLVPKNVCTNVHACNQ